MSVSSDESRILSSYGKAAEKHIIPCATLEHVIAGATNDKICATAPIQRIS